MDAELKAKWVAALRSGEYEQGRDHLITNGGKYCCIGVGVKVLFPDFDLYPETATVHAADKLGLFGQQQEVLVSMNDLDGKSFAEIADYIEKHL